MPSSWLLFAAAIVTLLAAAMVRQYREFTVPLSLIFAVLGVFAYFRGKGRS